MWTLSSPTSTTISAKCHLTRGCRKIWSGIVHNLNLSHYKQTPLWSSMLLTLKSSPPSTQCLTNQCSRKYRYQHRHRKKWGKITLSSIMSLSYSQQGSTTTSDSTQIWTHWSLHRRLPTMYTREIQWWDKRQTSRNRSGSSQSRQTSQLAIFPNIYKANQRSKTQTLSFHSSTYITTRPTRSVWGHRTSQLNQLPISMKYKGTR